MNSETFFDNFGMLADVPDGVSKLRGLILQLAAQGKLVPQDPNDEPAAVLLGKIKAEKERLVKEGKIRKPKKLPGISEDEILFDLPICWEWSRLNDFGTIFNGNSVNSHKKTIYSKVKEGMPYIATKDVGYGSLDIRYDNGIKIPFGEEKFKVAHANSILICSEGGSAGKKIGLTNRDICFGNKLFANETFNGVLPKYVFYLYQSRFFRLSFNEKMTGIIGGISLSNFLSLVVPLPPLNEQKRIVARVDQLMALCDELEIQQQKKQESRLRLNSAALDKLLTAHEPAEFANHWQRVCDNFDLLYDNPETVGELRKAILQLAVQGRLVRQDANDEPAAVLLEKIKAEKDRLVKEGRIKKSKLFQPIKADEMPFAIPKEWKWRRFGDLAEIVGGVTKGRKLDGKQTAYYPYLRVANVQRGFLDLDLIKKIENPIGELEKYRLKKGDILITEGGDWDKVGRSAIWGEQIEECIHQNHVFRARSFDMSLKSQWICIFTNSLAGRRYFETASKKTTNLASINMTQLRNCPIPIPPVDEQDRILKALSKIMTLCDALESKLKQSQTDGAKLMEAVVHKLVAA